MNTKRNIFFATLVLITIISSCTVLSFYPIYTEDVLIKNDAILGKWETIEESFPNDENNDTLVWEIAFNKERWIKKLNTPFDRGEKKVINEYAYSLYLSRKSTPEKRSEFQLHLINLAGKTFIDFYPEQWESDNNILGFHLIGVHTFAKVDIMQDSLIINWFDSDWFAQKLEEKKIRIKHEKNSSNILLTAQPKELQKFVVKYADDKNAFDYDSQFVLKPHK
ncbi:hypothetical protein [Saccharicrinis aurantiacus]|uniref:hypothetical protein n=1 Tax=Saccharicrinis aurantiacus TaxID=1849719 RepID=UPI000838DF97|nr:hypothetical protein [Saccharicrinis aurantiacus]